jgi:hypothetical protein
MKTDQLEAYAQLFTTLLRLGDPSNIPPRSMIWHSPVVGDPNGNLLGGIGDLVVRLDTAEVYIKTTGTAQVPTESGWAVLSGGGGGTTSGDFTPYGMRLVGISGYGAVDTAVLLFTSSPAVGDFGLPTADWLVQTNDANAGSTFQIIREGNYEVMLNTPTNNQNPGESSFTGITLNASGALLTAPPIFGVFPDAWAGSADQDASLPSTLTCTVTIPVPQEEIDAGRGVIRFQNTPGAPLVNALVGFRMRRLGPCVLP